jgi:hypothetical protein
VFDRSKASTTQLFLKGARVTSEFCSELFDAANGAGVTPNEFCITAAVRNWLLVAGASLVCSASVIFHGEGRGVTGFFMVR